MTKNDSLFEFLIQFIDDEEEIERFIEINSREVMCIRRIHDLSRIHQ